VTGSAAERPSESDRPAWSSSGYLPPGDRRRVLGRKGESLAARWYEGRGYEVLERNWRRRQGEVDLIVERGSTVAFCEVKVRSDDRYGTGAEAVPVVKQRRIRRLAAQWLAERHQASGRSGPRGAIPGRSASARDRPELRFDVVSVTAGRVEVIQDAF
jgi:putative endonuclease